MRLWRVCVATKKVEEITLEDLLCTANHSVECRELSEYMYYDCPVDANEYASAGSRDEYIGAWTED